MTRNSAPIGASVRTAWSGWPSHVPLSRLRTGTIRPKIASTRPWTQSPNGPRPRFLGIDQPDEQASEHRLPSSLRWTGVSA